MSHTCRRIAALPAILTVLFAGTAAGYEPAFFGFGREAYPNPMQFNEVNLQTGRHYTVSRFTNVQGIVSSGPFAFDVKSNLFYIAVTEMTSADTQHLYTITGVSGQQLYNAPLGSPTFNNLYTVSGVLYGFAFYSMTQRVYRINPASGALTQLAGYTNSLGLQSVAFDPVSNRLYAATLNREMDTNQFLVINATNGTLLSTPLRTNDMSQMYCSKGALYGMYARGGTNRLVRVNIASGAETQVQVFPTNFGGISGTYMDYVGARVYVWGVAENTNMMTVLNPDTGEILSRYPQRLSHLAYYANPWAPYLVMTTTPMQVSWNTYSGHVYQIQSQTNLLLTSWSNVTGGRVTGRGGETSVVDAASRPFKVFRILVNP